MAKFNRHIVYWWLTNRAHQLGAWGLIGLALILASLLFYQVKVRPLSQQVQQAQAAAMATSQVKSFSAQQANQNVLPTETTAQQMAAFYARFANADQLPEALALMNRLASQKRLALNSGNYKLTQLKQNKIVGQATLTQYEIVLPVTGPYAHIRSYLAEVLFQLPALVLTDMQLQRETTLDENIEAKLVFVLFVKSQSW